MFESLFTKLLCRYFETSKRANYIGDISSGGSADFRHYNYRSGHPGLGLYNTSFRVCFLNYEFAFVENYVDFFKTYRFKANVKLGYHRGERTFLLQTGASLYFYGLR